jgi:hypothetical protein
MAGRSKRRGVPVEDLTHAELLAERKSVLYHMSVSSKIVHKLLSKRLLKIEKRLAREFPTTE